MEKVRQRVPPYLKPIHVLPPPPTGTMRYEQSAAGQPKLANRGAWMLSSYPASPAVSAKPSG